MKYLVTLSLCIILSAVLVECKTRRRVVYKSSDCNNGCSNSPGKCSNSCSGGNCVTRRTGNCDSGCSSNCQSNCNYCQSNCRNCQTSVCQNCDYSCQNCNSNTCQQCTCTNCPDKTCQTCESHCSNCHARVCSQCNDCQSSSCKKSCQICESNNCQNNNCESGCNNSNCNVVIEEEPDFAEFEQEIIPISPRIPDKDSQQNFNLNHTFHITNTINTINNISIPIQANATSVNNIYLNHSSSARSEGGHLSSSDYGSNATDILNVNLENRHQAPYTHPSVQTERLIQPQLTQHHAAPIYVPMPMSAPAPVPVPAPIPAPAPRSCAQAGGCASAPQQCCTVVQQPQCHVTPTAPYLQCYQPTHQTCGNHCQQSQVVYAMPQSSCSSPTSCGNPMQYYPASNCQQTGNYPYVNCNYG